MSIPKHFAASALLVLGLQSVAAIGADRTGSLRPEAVSPGRLDRIVEMADGCFGYSWSTLEGARGFELAVHRVDGVAASVETAATTPALRVRVPATLSWTPSLEECLPPGRYGWLVRAETAAGWTGWSEPRLFAVREVASGGPSFGPPRPAAPNEIERAARAPSGDVRTSRIVEFRQSSGGSPFTAAPQRLRPLTGAAFSPPSCDGTIFSDVGGGNPNCAWIEQLAADEITDPCEGGVPGRYCPDQPITRGQIAKLLGRVMRGTDAWRPEQGDGASSNLPPAPVGLTPLQTGGDVGQHTTATIGADGLGLIGYESEGGNVWVSHCANVQCTATDASALVDSGGGYGYPSITIGADGLGLVSYYDANFGDLKVAHCADVSCTFFDEREPLDTAGDVGKFNSITIGADGFGLISYYDASAFRLKAAHCSNTKCTTATASPITSPNVLEDTSITIGADGHGMIS
jgi:hypothetical protein